MSRIQQVSAYLCADGAAHAIDYYVEAFGAREKFRLADSSGRIAHAELDFGGTTIMLADEFPEMGARGPKSIGGTGVSIHMAVDDADAVLERAVKAGGEILRPAEDQFYGERSGTLRDPFGHEWHVAHEIEAVSPGEMQRRFDAMSDE